MKVKGVVSQSVALFAFLLVLMLLLSLAVLAEVLSSLAVNSNPKGASVYINGTLRGQTRILLTLPVGSYEVRVSKEGFEPYTAEVQVEEGNRAYLFPTLEPIPGYTPPSPAEPPPLTKKGKKKPAGAPARTRPSFNPSPSAKASAKGQKPQMKEPVPARQDESLATLIVKSSPPGAVTVLNGKEMGRTPLVLHASPGESHVLKLFLKGFQEYRSRFSLPQEGTTINISLLRLTPAKTVPSTGRVSVETSPPGVQIHVDEKVMGNTPSFFSLPAGKHTVALSAPGLKGYRKEIELEENKTVFLSIEMRTARKPASPILLSFLALPLLLALVFWKREWLRATFTSLLSPPDRLVLLPQGGMESLESVGNYRLHERLSSGGMGIVYRGENLKTGQETAIKVLYPHLTPNEKLVKKFLSEITIGEALHHPNIVRILEGEHHGNFYFLVMELVKGEDLRKIMEREKPLAVEKAVKLVMQVCEALDYAHAKGVIHQDLKPENIMVTQDGTVKLLDYGVARSLSSGTSTLTATVMGTPIYLCPDLLLGMKGDPQTDIYSLGVIFYEMVTGQLPFPQVDPVALLTRPNDDPPRLPSSLNNNVPPALDQIILRMLEREREARYRSAEEIIKALQGYLYHLSTEESS